MQNAVGGMQSVLVLGGASDLATASVEALAARGCTRVVLAARHPESLDEVEQRSRAAGVKDVRRLTFDAGEFTTHDDVVRDAFADGDIDLVLVAFGVLGRQSDFDGAPDDAVAAAEVNYVGAVSAMMRIVPRFRAQDHGTFVVLSSVAGERVRADNYVYGSTKAGL